MARFRFEETTETGNQSQIEETVGNITLLSVYVNRSGQTNLLGGSPKGPKDRQSGISDRELFGGC